LALISSTSSPSAAVFSAVIASLARFGSAGGFDLVSRSRRFQSFRGLTHAFLS
jgi:hypothetical protein